MRLNAALDRNSSKICGGNFLRAGGEIDLSCVKPVAGRPRSRPGGTGGAPANALRTTETHWQTTC